MAKFIKRRSYFQYFQKLKVSLSITEVKLITTDTGAMLQAIINRNFTTRIGERNIVEKAVQMRILYPLGSPNFEDVSKRFPILKATTFHEGFTQYTDSLYKSIDVHYLSFLQSPPEKTKEFKIMMQKILDVIKGEINNIRTNDPVSYFFLAKAIMSMKKNIDVNFSQRDFFDKALNLGKSLTTAVSEDILVKQIKDQLQAFLMIVPPFEALKAHISILDDRINTQSSNLKPDYFGPITTQIHLLKSALGINPIDLSEIEKILIDIRKRTANEIINSKSYPEKQKLLLQKINAEMDELLSSTVSRCTTNLYTLHGNQSPPTLAISKSHTGLFAQEVKLPLVVPFSISQREQLVEQANAGRFGAIFTPQDIIRVQRSDNQFDLYVLDRKNLVGKGSNSEIYKAYPLSADGKIYDDTSQYPPIAVKFISKEQKATTSKEYKEAVAGINREAYVLKELDKLNYRVTTSIDEYKEGAGDYLFMPLYQGKKILVSDEKGVALVEDISEAKMITQRFDLMCQLGEQVKALHDNALIHGDLHPSNILLTRGQNNEMQLKLIDFDQSRTIESLDELKHFDGTIKMAFPIRPPEIAEKLIGAASDIYALGLNFLFILGHKNPFATYDNDFIKILKDEYKKMGKYKDLVIAYQASPEYQKLPEKLKEKSLYDYERALIKEKITEAYIEKRWLEQVKPIEIGNLEIDGKPVGQEVQDFIKRMLSKNANDRPTINEVNQFLANIPSLGVAVNQRPL